MTGIHRMGTSLVNWYLVEGGGRLTAVDAGLPRFADDLEGQVGALGFGLGDVEAVVLTHSDSDHTGVVCKLRSAGARVLIHADDEASLREPGPKSGDASPGRLVRQLWRPALWRFMGRMARGGGMKPAGIEGEETFADGDVLDVPGSPRVIHTPGHTPGHCALLFEGHGALFVGDELCTWNPFTGGRRPQLMPAVFNESNDDCRRSLDVLEPLEASVLLPGHGDPWREGPGAAVAEARRISAVGAETRAR